VAIYLTEVGEALLKRLEPKVQEVDAFLASLTVDEAKQLNQLLDAARQQQ